MLDSSSCILDILEVIDFSLILLCTSKGIYSIPQESKYAAVFVSINNGTQCFPLLFYHIDLLHTFHLLLYANCFLKDAIKSRFIIEIIINLDIV